MCGVGGSSIHFLQMSNFTLYDRLNKSLQYICTTFSLSIHPLMGSSIIWLLSIVSLTSEVSFRSDFFKKIIQGIGLERRNRIFTVFTVYAKLGRPRQEDYQFEATLHYIMILCTINQGLRIKGQS